MQIEVYVPDLGAEFVLPFAIVVEGVEKGTRYLNEQALQDLYVKAKQNFEESIVRPKYSATLGGTVYRSGQRATGSFTFGPGRTFEGRVTSRGPVQEVEFPDIDRADAQTDGAWRALEFGTDSVTMPIGYWRDGAKRVPGRVGGDDELVPGGRGTIEVGGIEPKAFIESAVNSVADRLEQSYLDMIDIIHDEIASLPPAPILSQPPAPGMGYTVWVSTPGRITQTGPAAGFEGYWRRPPVKGGRG